MLWQRDEGFSSATISSSVLANQAAIMIEHARLYEDLQQKEQRLERFVDRFLRQAEQRRSSLDLTESPLQEMLRSGRRVGPGDSQGAAGRRARPAVQRLTQREQEVLDYIVQGLTNKEIATQLYLSPDTVKNHVVHIMEKLGAQDRTQAAVYAIRNGLVETEPPMEAPRFPGADTSWVTYGDRVTGFLAVPCHWHRPIRRGGAWARALRPREAHAGPHCQVRCPRLRRPGTDMLSR